MRPPSVSPFDSEEEEEDNDKNKDQKKGERAVETGNMYEKANSTMDNSRASTGDCYYAFLAYSQGQIISPFHPRE